MSADQLTILSSRWRRLAKTITRDGEIIPYDRARIFDFFERPVSSLADIGGWLSWLSDRQDCCVVRAAILDPARTQGVRRLLFPDSKTGEQPTLREVARQWVALDFDNLPPPENVQVADLASCAVVAIERLPLAFRGSACIVQATASHGIKPGLRLRLWYWLSRPTTGAELKAWLRATPVDKSVFNGAQPIYTAAPVFLDGATSPIRIRLAMLPGRHAVDVPTQDVLKVQPVAALPVRVRPTVPQTGRQSFAALSRAALRIALAVEGTRHRTLVVEASRLSRLVSAGGLSVDDVRMVLLSAAELVGTPPEEAQSIIEWALARAPAAALGSIDL
jgi:hypothetical protein